MADKGDRGDAAWQRFLDLVPPEKLSAVPERPAAPVPPPVAASVAEPALAQAMSEEATVRHIELQIVNDRKTEDQKRFKIERDAQQEAFESMRRIHDLQNGMKL